MTSRQAVFLAAAIRAARANEPIRVEHGGRAYWVYPSGAVVPVK